MSLQGRAVGVGLMLTGLILSLSCAVAQQPTRIRGEIIKVEGETITVKTRDRGDEKVRMTDKTIVLGLARAGLPDLKPNAFIGVGAMPEADGTRKAIQVTIFMESQRGLGEGHRPWDRPGSTMTNGAVATTVSAVDGQTLTVRYKDGAQKILVTPESVIRAYVAAERSEIRPGVHVAVVAAKKADGSLEAERVTVGRGGVIP